MLHVERRQFARTDVILIPNEGVNERGCACTHDYCNSKRLLAESMPHSWVMWSYFDSFSPRKPFIYNHNTVYIHNSCQKIPKFFNELSGIQKSCGAVVARRSYMFRQTHMTLIWLCGCRGFEWVLPPVWLVARVLTIIDPTRTIYRLLFCTFCHADFLLNSRISCLDSKTEIREQLVLRLSPFCFGEIDEQRWR